MIRGPTRVALQSLIFFLSILIFGTTTVASTNMNAPVVDLLYARYQGYFDAQKNTTNFFGIRYAAPPLGNLRFKAPEPPAFEPGIQLATQSANMCYQGGPGENINMTTLVRPYGFNRRQSTTPTVSEDEDCLFLNVFVPGKMAANRVGAGVLPVLVWIHGGGYASGDAGGDYVANLLEDSLNTVVVVSIQYRLGLFGFLSGTEVKAHGVLNAGLDQNFALQWVQDYIGLFGGDRTHVTIWGESAGAGSVLQHIVANGGDTQPPLFNAAMVSSTYLPSQYYYNERVPELLYNKVASMSGCSSRANSLTCLQSADVATLETANSVISASGFAGTYLFVPVVDGTFIVERPTVTLAKGQVNGKVLLAFNNQEEGNTLVDVNETLAIVDYVSQLFPDMTPEQVREAAIVYNEYGTAIEQAMQVIGDSIIVCPTYYLLSAFAGHSWKGLFAIPPAYHGYDEFYYFNIDTSFRYNNTQFIKAFSQSFMSLTKYYDVNRKFDPTNITPVWNKYNVGETEMLFNHTEDGKPEIVPFETDTELLKRCAFWSMVTPTTAQ